MLSKHPALVDFVGVCRACTLGLANVHQQVCATKPGRRDSLARIRLQKIRSLKKGTVFNGPPLARISLPKNDRRETSTVSLPRLIV